MLRILSELPGWWISRRQNPIIVWHPAAAAPQERCIVPGRLRTALVICSLAVLAPAEPADSKEPVLVGKAAPDFQVITLDGKTLTLADFKDQVLVINFWATWCTPCKRELPLLDRYYQLKQPVGLRVLAVTTEGSLPLSQLKPLAAALSIPMVRRFKGNYGPLKGVPTNYVIDRQGVLRYAEARSFTLEDLNNILLPLLREHAPAAPEPPGPQDKGQPDRPGA
jgi:cytochrome c biogenesis protein CcmG/thiol:disulfide interchange protein DsbE